MAQLANGAHCICGNKDGVKFRRYIDKATDEMLGAYCVECGTEFLKNDFLVSGRRDQLNLGNDYLYSSGRPGQSADVSCMVQPEKTKIENLELFGTYLKPGDHIAWQRSKAGIIEYWHHAIVESVNLERSKIQVIHWSGNQKSEAKIREDWLDLKKEKGSLYRIDYREEVEKANPTKLVIARARSRIDEKGYNLFKDNCEFFATFCKKGVEKSQQVLWLMSKIKDFVTTTAESSVCHVSRYAIFVGKDIAKTSVAEGIEIWAKHGQIVGAGLVIAIEGVWTVWNIWGLTRERKAGDISRKEFIERVISRITSAVLGGSLAILGGLVPGFVAALFVGSLCGIAGKLVGSWIGPMVGKMIADTIMTNDRAIKSIQDLDTGDHVVFYSYFCHPRHHAIVLWYDEETNQINIIHSTYTYGVTEEWVDFESPIYKVQYRENECRPKEEVTARAISKLGENKYNILWSNCKHFAQWCKQSR